MINSYKESIKRYNHKAMQYISIFLKWVVIALISGVVIGIVGAFFHKALDFATESREENAFLIYLLPIVGVIIVWLYRVTDMEYDKGTNQIILSAQGKGRVHIRTAPLIFLSTFLTHLCGGSAGREGAALQLGGSLISPVGRLLHFKKNDYSILIMCGMAAGFSSLFGTPAAAAVFAIEVTVVGYTQYAAIVPCMVSATTATVVAKLLGCTPTSFSVSALPELSFEHIYAIIATILLAIGGAAAALAFCRVLRVTKALYEKLLPNVYLRAIVGGLLVIILTLIVGNNDYNGAGTSVIIRAFDGDVFWAAFLLKILFTAVTLGAGFRGGEIVPTIFIGATLGSFLAGVMQIDASFGAAIGVAAVFCGVTNCPLATIILCAEIFGGDSLIYYALAVGISYMLSGYDGLYSAQSFMGGKLFAKRIET